MKWQFYVLNQIYKNTTIQSQQFKCFGNQCRLVSICQNYKLAPSQGQLHVRGLPSLQQCIRCIIKQLGKKLFAGKLNNWYQWYLSKDRVAHYGINSLLYITTLREKFVKMQENYIGQLKMYANAIRVLSKGYLPISLLPQ